MCMSKGSAKRHRTSAQPSPVEEWAVVVLLRNGDRMYYAPGLRSGPGWTDLVSRATLWGEAEAGALAEGMDIHGRIVSYEVERVTRRPPGR